MELKYQSQKISAVNRRVFFIQRRNFVGTDLHFSARCIVQGADNIEQGAFAAPAFAQDDGFASAF